MTGMVGVEEVDESKLRVRRAARVKSFHLYIHKSVKVLSSFMDNGRSIQSDRRTAKLYLIVHLKLLRATVEVLQNHSGS